MTKQTPWAVLLCRFKDTNQVNIPLDLTNRLFTSAGHGTFNVPRFFSDVSHGLLDLSGSQVFPQTPEYFTVDAYLNDYVAPTDPPPPGWQAKITRDQLISKAWQAAVSAGVPLVSAGVPPFISSTGSSSSSTRRLGSPLGVAHLSDHLPVVIIAG